MSKQKVEMVAAILILLYSSRRGILIDRLEKPQNLHSQKLWLVVLFDAPHPHDSLIATMAAMG